MPASVNKFFIVAACLLGAVVLCLPAAIRKPRLTQQRSRALGMMLTTTGGLLPSLFVAPV
jgi:hypothetical protein